MLKTAKIIQEKTGIDIRNIPGSGAAGGISGTFLALLNAKIKKGFEFIADANNLDAKIKSSQLIITGEGSYDSTSKGGKGFSFIEKIRIISLTLYNSSISNCPKSKIFWDSGGHYLW